MMASVKSIFNLSQRSMNQDPFVGMLHKLYTEIDYKDFIYEFKKWLLVPLAAKDQELAVNRIMQLTAKFIAKMNSDALNASDEEQDVSVNSVQIDLLHFLLEAVNSAHYTVRVRVLSLMTKILKELSELSCDDKLNDSLYKMALTRLKDITAAVRAEAVLVASYLQDPSNPDCPIIKAFVFHMKHDPSYLTRRNVAQFIAVTVKTLQPLRERLRDVNPLVRKTALIRISEKVSVRCFSIVTRVEMLETCLGDTNLRPILKQKLLPAWLKICNGDLVAFLELLDLPGSPKAIKETLTMLFELDDLRLLVRKMNLDPETHLLSLDRLKDETAFLWRCLCQYVKTVETEFAADIFEEITPTISDFCSYFESYMNKVSESDKEMCEHVFTLEQLLLLVEELDFNDIYGLKKLHDLVLSALNSPTCLVEMIEPLVTCMYKMQTSRKEFLKKISEICIQQAEGFISGTQAMDDYLKNLIKGLLIAACGLKLATETELPSCIVELKDKLFLPCLSHKHSKVRLAAFDAFGLYCLLDMDEAQESYGFFIDAISNDTLDIQIEAASTAFDILLLFGPELVVGIAAGQYKDGSESFMSMPEEENLFLVFQEHLVPLLDSQVLELRTIAAKGFAKLLLLGRIRSANLFSRLFLMCYNPAYEDDEESHHYLTQFFPAYATSGYLKLDCLKKTFKMAVKVILEAPRTSAIASVDVFTVGVAILQLSTLVKQYVSANGCEVHNAIAVEILEMMWTQKKSQSLIVLSRILNNADVNGDNTLELIKATEEVLQNLKDKTSTRNVKKFLEKLKSQKVASIESLQHNSSTVEQSNQSFTTLSQSVSAFEDSPLSDPKCQHSKETSSETVVSETLSENREIHSDDCIGENDN